MTPLALFHCEDLEAFVDLEPELGLGEVVGDEDRADRAAQLFERLVGGMLRSAAGEPPEDLLGLGCAEPQGGGVFDELVVLPGDQLRADRAGQDLLDTRVA
jgi:hypothetical protein